MGAPVPGSSVRRSTPTPREPPLPPGKHGNRVRHSFVLDQFEVRRQEGLQFWTVNTKRRPFGCGAKKKEAGQQPACRQQPGHPPRVIEPAVLRQRAEKRAFVDPARLERWLVSKEIRLLDHVAMRAQLFACGGDCARREVDRANLPALPGKQQRLPGIAAARNEHRHADVPRRKRLERRRHAGLIPRRVTAFEPFVPECRRVGVARGEVRCGRGGWRWWPWWPWWP